MSSWIRSFTTRITSCPFSQLWLRKRCHPSVPQGSGATTTALSSLCRRSLLALAPLALRAIRAENRSFVLRREINSPRILRMIIMVSVRVSVSVW